jgi:transposase-like protein
VPPPPGPDWFAGAFTFLLFLAFYDGSMLFLAAQVLPFPYAAAVAAIATPVTYVVTGRIREQRAAGSQPSRATGLTPLCSAWKQRIGSDPLFCSLCLLFSLLPDGKGSGLCPGCPQRGNGLSGIVPPRRTGPGTRQILVRWRRQADGGKGGSRAGWPQALDGKTAGRISSLYLRGETSVAEAARQHGITVAEVEEWRERFLTSAENGLRSKPAG